MGRLFFLDNPGGGRSSVSPVTTLGGGVRHHRIVSAGREEEAQLIRIFGRR